MTPFFLHVRAPFAAFRWMQAGVYRATSPVIPPSAAYGLLMNLAGVEIRGPTDNEVTLIRADAPLVALAVGRVGPLAGVGTVYQQLHSYPVGNSGKELQARAHGAKFWIAPARRELLIGLDAVIAVRDGPADLRTWVEAGLRGERPRYGLPFAGDNNLLIDHIDLLDEAPLATWYARLEGSGGSHRGSCRLTTCIDRADASRTETALVAPGEPTANPPEGAWFTLPRS